MTEQQFEMQKAERAKPLFRVQIYNRDHGPANWCTRLLTRSREGKNAQGKSKNKFTVCLGR